LLLKHSSFLKGNFNKQKAILAMKKDGLFSKFTYWFDVNLDEAVKEAKRRKGQ